MLALAIAVRILANPFANVFQKILTRKSADPFFIILATHALLSVACLPVCLYLWPHLPARFWLDISLCAALAVAGNSFLVAALRVADLSVLGPINAYKSVVSLIPAMLVLGEFPSLRGLCGIALIIGGSYFLVAPTAAGTQHNLFLRFVSDRGIQYRFAALTLAAIEAVFLKRALLESSPLITFAFWCVLGLAVALPASALLGTTARRQTAVFFANRRNYASLALSTGLMQLCTLLTLQQMQVGYSLALFQISTLLSVFLGRRVFAEPHFLKRLCGSAVMIAGALLITLKVR
jgi:drug/metabolite transporter (DMT)-like permease